MLVVLGMIIAKAADPATWAWLANDQAAVKQPDGAAAPAGGLPPAPPVTAQQKETVLEGPTDEDIEETDGAAEEFMALSDGGLRAWARKKCPPTGDCSAGRCTSHSPSSRNGPAATMFSTSSSAIPTSSAASYFIFP